MNIRSFSKPELLALLGAARAKRERDWLLILVTYWHGLRASEVIALTPDDVRDGYITVQRLKGSLRTTHPLVENPDPLLDERAAMFDLLAKSTGNQRLFPITRQRFWQLVKEYGRVAGIPDHKLHPHALKHSIAMHTVDSAGVHMVKQYLGHKELSSTGAYVEKSDEEASAAIARASGV